MKALLYLIFAVSLFASVPRLTETLTPVEVAKLTDPYFAGSGTAPVAISGDILAVGRYATTYSTAAVHLYQRNQTSGNYSKIAELTGSRRVYGDGFGANIAISGDTVVVATRNTIYVYEKPGNGWNDMTESARYTDSTALFGRIAISGDTVVVGDSGKAHLFEKPASGWTNMTPSTVLIPAVTDYYFGLGGIAIDGDIVLVGGLEKVYLYEKLPNGWTNVIPNAILSTSDTASDDAFGRAVAISGDTIVVGAYGDDDSGSNSGSVYIFEKPVSGWVNMTQNAKLTASDAAADDHFGAAVAINGDVVAVGVVDDDDNGTSTGSTYIFEKPGSSWSDMTQSSKLTASDATSNDRFGRGVAIDGDVIAVGALGGKAYVFEFEQIIDFTENSQDVIEINATDAEGDTISYALLAEGDATQFTLDASSGTLRFNTPPDFERPVDADGDNRYRLSLQLGDNNGESRRYTLIIKVSDIFEPPPPIAENFKELQRINAKIPMDYGDFGTSVAIGSNDVIVVGSSSHNDTGAVYIFEYNATSKLFEQRAKLMAFDASPDDFFGASVAISGDVVAVGAYGDDDYSGSVYVFEKPASGWVDTNESSKLRASDAAVLDSFGRSVAISNNVIIAGAWRVGTDSGRAYIFEKPASGWTHITQNAKLTASDTAANDAFGISVAISGDIAVVGAYVDDDGGESSGSAYVFEKNGTHWSDMTESAKLTASDAVPGAVFGISVAIDGTIVVVGASDRGNNGPGRAYLFYRPSNGWSNTTENTILTASDAAAGDQFGGSVAIDGTLVVVGAVADDDGGSFSGGAYLFDISDSLQSNSTQNIKFTASDARANDLFGASVAINGDVVVMGAPWDDQDGRDTGSAYIYKEEKSISKLIPTLMYLLN